MEFEVIKRTPSEKRTYCLAALKIYKRLFCALGMPYSRTGISIYDYVEITLKDKFGYERGTHDRKDWLIAVASQAKLPQKQNKNKTTKRKSTKS